MPIKSLGDLKKKYRQHNRRINVSKNLIIHKQKPKVREYTYKCGFDDGKNRKLGDCNLKWD